MNVRLIAAAALLASASVHLKVWNDEEKHVSVLGPLFLVQAGSGVAIAILLLTWRHWLAPLLAAGLAAGTLIGFTIATTPSGLLGDHETWQGGYTWLAAVTETIAIAAGLVAFSRELWTSPIPERESVRS